MIRKKLSLILTTALVSISLIGATNVNAKPLKHSHKKNTTYKTHRVNEGESHAQQNQRAKLTIMMYMDGDNNLEGALLNDIEEMKRGYVNNPDLNLIVLIDRAPGYSNDSRVLGENFEDTRMYKIEHNRAIRINGESQFPEVTTTSRYEANMGDANTLKKFINSCKANYPADKYMLMMSNHGGGAKAKDLKRNLDKAICWDDTNNNDCLYMAEISDVLTRDQSVDVLGFDACLMGTAEVAYQFRPNNGGFQAHTMIASSPTVWGNGFKYDNVLQRLRSGVSNSMEIDSTLGGREQFFNPATITNEQLGALFVEEQKDSTVRVNDQQLSCYDLTRVQAVKNSVDALAKDLSLENKKDAIEMLRGSFGNTNLIHYFNENNEMDWIEYPYFDLYDLCQKITTSKQPNNPSKDLFSNTTKLLARNVMANVDSMILYSFGGSKFRGFQNGRNGVSIFLPDGNRNYVDQFSGRYIPHWAIQRWYNPLDTVRAGLNTPYGKLDWCRNNLDNRINRVGNWFELLDSWFDYSNDRTGGFNHYQW